VGLGAERLNWRGQNRKKKKQNDVIIGVLERKRRVQEEYD
jgi:hypothetical protein